MTVICITSHLPRPSIIKYMFDKEGSTILIELFKEVVWPNLLVTVALVFLMMTTKVISDFHSAPWMAQQNNKKHLTYLKIKTFCYRNLTTDQRT